MIYFILYLFYILLSVQSICIGPFSFLVNLLFNSSFICLFKYFVLIFIYFYDFFFVSNIRIWITKTSSPLFNGQTKIENF